MLSKSLIQFSVDGRGCVPSLLFDLRPNYGGGNEINSDLLQKVDAGTAALSAPNPAAGHRQPMPLPETPGHSRASRGQSLVGSLLLSPGSWCTQGFVCVLQESVFQSYVSSGGSLVGLMVTFSKRKNQRSDCQHLLDHQKKKARGFQQKTYFCFIDYTKAFDCVDHNKLENS